jgi:hypothetical protein
VQRVIPGRKGFLGIGSSPATTNSVPEPIWKSVEMVHDDGKKYYTPANGRIWKIMMMLQDAAQKGGKNTK